MAISDPISLGEATPDELPEASRVMLQAYEEYAADLPADMWEGYRRDIVDVWGRLEESELILARSEGRIVGAVTYYPLRNSGQGEHANAAGIRLLAVEPASRGKGIGRRLVLECIERTRARGVPSIVLHTTELMSVAAGMYERMGFVRLPKLDHHVRPGLTVKAYELRL